MQLKNTSSTYGLVSIFAHWMSVPIVLGMFALGLWMVDLDYDSSWYKTAPHIHRSVGVLFVAFMLLRFFWRLKSPIPLSIGTHKSWEKIVSKVVQYFMYLLVFLMFPTGYLITTAKGQSLEVFNWFSIPPLITTVDGLELTAGELHEIFAFALIGLIAVHAIAALKHHFMDKDKTLKRMFNKE